MDLLHASLAMVKQCFYRDYSQRRADIYVQGKPGLEQSFERGIDLASFARVLNSGGREAPHLEERAIITAAFTGSLLTAARLHSWCLAVSPMRPRCGKPDILRHRLEDDCGDSQAQQLTRQLKLSELVSDFGGSAEECGNSLRPKRLEVPAAYQPTESLDVRAIGAEGLPAHSGVFFPAG